MLVLICIYDRKLCLVSSSYSTPLCAKKWLKTRTLVQSEAVTERFLCLRRQCQNSPTSSVIVNIARVQAVSLKMRKHGLCYQVVEKGPDTSNNIIYKVLERINMLQIRKMACSPSRRPFNRTKAFLVYWSCILIYVQFYRHLSRKFPYTHYLQQRQVPVFKRA